MLANKMQRDLLIISTKMKKVEQIQKNLKEYLINLKKNLMKISKITLKNNLKEKDQ